jgi:hypothetical protein
MTEPRTGSRPYAKAHLDVMRRRDLKPPEKLILVVLDRLRGLGKEWTTDRLVFETGLGLRTVQVALKSLGLARPAHRPKRAEEGAEKRAEKRAEFCYFRPAIKTDNNNDSIREQGGKSTTAPPPSAPADPAKTTAGAAASPAAPGPGSDALVSMIALRFGGRFSDAEIAGHVASDTGARLYTRTDLAAWYAAGRTAAYPSHLKRLVPQFVAEQTREGFVRRVAEIRSGGLTDARHSDGRRAEVRLVDTDPPRLILETCEGGVSGATAAELQDQIAGLRWPFVGSAREQGLRRRLEAVQSGLPDPAARPGERTQIVVSSPADLATWTFRPRQPTLFSLDGPPARAPP